MPVIRAVLFVLLLPFSLLFMAGAGLRNLLYRWGIYHATRFDLPVISVGNLAVGGTGKTPHVEYLIRKLAPELPIATLSRGYGRKTSGYRLAGPQDNATTLGDEPMQYHRKFGQVVSVAVGEERALAIPALLGERPGTKVILLDDAFQHRPVSPSLSLLLTDYRRPFYADWFLPAGRLREFPWGAKRADVVIVTKCPSVLDPVKKQRMRNRIARFTRKDTPIAFTGIGYATPQPFEGPLDGLPKKWMLVTGIARPETLIEHVEDMGELVEHLRFADHHRFSLLDLKRIHDQFRVAGEGVALLTTEKDRMRLEVAEGWENVKNLPWYTQPIEVVFLEGEQAFLAQVNRAVAG